MSKKIAMVIAFKNFQDEEYFVPKEILENTGIEIKTISTQKGLAVGAYGGETNIDILLTEVNLNDFDAMVFIGGSGALEELDNEDSYQIVRETVSQNKILAAICISPVILAKAGVLKGKRATVWSSMLDREPIKTLQDYEAIYHDSSIVVNGNIITANGPAVAKEFGEKIIKGLTK